MQTKIVGLLKGLRILLTLVLIGLLLLVVSPLWFLFVRLANLIGINGLRRVNGKLQTPVIFYEHPITKRIVVFVATIHLGEPEYFVELQKCIDSLASGGYKVLFERVQKLTPEEEECLTDKERRVSRQLQALFELVQEIGKIMSLQHQKSGLTYDAAWINTDVSQYELIQLLASQNVTLLKKEKGFEELFNDEVGKLAVRWLVNKLFDGFIAVAVISYVASLFSSNKRRIRRIILDNRNEVGLRGINECLSRGNVVTIWGAGHLRGIEKSLKDCGFREVRRAWFTAYNIRSYGLLDLLKKHPNTKVTKNATTTKDGG